MTEDLVARSVAPAPPDSAARMDNRQLAGEMRRLACLFDHRHLNCRVLLEAADRLEGRS